MSTMGILNTLMERVMDHAEVRWFHQAMSSGRDLSTAERLRIRALIRIGIVM